MKSAYNNQFNRIKTGSVRTFVDSYQLEVTVCNVCIAINFHFSLFSKT